MARAMHNRCCSPPDKVAAGALRRSFTESHNAASDRAFSADSARKALSLTPMNRRPATALSRIDIVGKGLGRWKTMPIRLRSTVIGTVDL